MVAVADIFAQGEADKVAEVVGIGFVHVKEERKKGGKQERMVYCATKVFLVL